MWSSASARDNKSYIQLNSIIEKKEKTSTLRQPVTMASFRFITINSVWHRPPPSSFFSFFCYYYYWLPSQRFLVCLSKTHTLPDIRFRISWTDLLILQDNITWTFSFFSSSSTKRCAWMRIWLCLAAAAANRFLVCLPELCVCVCVSGPYT